MPKTHKKKMVDRVFGRLTVTEWDSDRSIPSKYQYWLCRCDCDGKIVSVRQDHLESGATTSCGCYHKDRVTETSHRCNRYERFDKNTIKMWASNKDIAFYIDIDDLDAVIAHSWYITPKGYLLTRIKNKLVELHRFLLDVTDPEVQVDHRDRDTTNNHRSNLRRATPQQNAFNRSKPKNNTSGCRGVCYSAYDRRWVVRVGKMFISNRKSYEEAVALRYEKEKELFGEFAPIRDEYGKG